MAKNQTDLLLQVHDKKQPKMRTSHNLTTEEYKKFKVFCKNRGVIPSAMMDALIKDFNESHDE